MCLQFTLSLEAVISSEDEATVMAVEDVVQEGRTAESSLAASIADVIRQGAKDEASPLAGVSIAEVIVVQAQWVEVVESTPISTPESVGSLWEVVEDPEEESESGINAGVWVRVCIGVVAVPGVLIWTNIARRRRRSQKDKLHRQYIDDMESIDDRNPAN